MGTNRVKDIYLEQFHTFGEQNRGNWDVHKATMSSHGFELETNHWLLQRFISIGYYALVDFSKVIPTPDIFSDLGGWHDIHQIPTLILDHNRIVEKALTTLRLMLDYKLVGFNLLSETFTMNELQSLYETILDKKLLRANFQRKMLSMEILERVEKKFSGKAHKPRTFIESKNNLKKEFSQSDNSVQKPFVVTVLCAYRLCHGQTDGLNYSPPNLPTSTLSALYKHLPTKAMLE